MSARCLHRWLRLAAVAAALLLAASPQPAIATKTRADPAPRGERWSRDKVAGVSLLAVGGASLVFSSIATVLAHRQFKRVSDSMAPGPFGFPEEAWTSELVSTRRTGRGLAIASWVAAPLGVAALVSGTVLLIKDRRRRRTQEPNPTTAVVLFEAGGGLAVRARF